MQYKGTAQLLFAQNNNKGPNYYERTGSVARLHKWLEPDGSEGYTLSIHYLTDGEGLPKGGARLIMGAKVTPILDCAVMVEAEGMRWTVVPGEYEGHH